MPVGRVRVVGLVCWLSLGCGQSPEPDGVRWVLSPSHGASTTPAQRSALERALGAAGAPGVHISVAESPAAAIEAVGASRAEIALLNVPEYLLARQEYECRAAAQATRRGGSREYSGVIVAKAGSEVADLRGLEGRRVAFVDEYSASGFLLPMAALERAGVRVEPVFAGSHERALRMVREGGAAAAAVQESFISSSAVEAAPNLVTLTRVGPIPNEPVCVRRGAPARTDRVVAALIELGASEEGRAALRPFADIEGFAPVGESAYVRVLAELREAGRRVEDTVPGGHTIVWSNLSPILTSPP